MPPDLQLSLCIPEILENHTEAELKEFVDNVTQFFAKFPIAYEILFAVKSHQQMQSPSLQAVSQTLAAKGAGVRAVIVTRFRSRAHTLEKLFTEAQGQVVVASSLDLRIPLGGIFKMLQELFTDLELQAVFGNRTSKKSSPTGAAKNGTPKAGLEAFFQNVISERTAWPFTDLFCPTLALKKSAFEKLKFELQSSGHHWTLEVQWAVKHLKLKAIEVPVFEASAANPASAVPLKGYGKVREALKLLSFVLFRVRGDDQ